MTTVVIIIIAIVAIIVATLVVAPQLTSRHRLGTGRGSGRRPGAADRSAETDFRNERRPPAGERDLLAEGEQIQQRVEAQVARDRASTHHRFRLNGRAEAARLARHPDEPIAPGFVPSDPYRANPTSDPYRPVDPAYDHGVIDPHDVPPADARYPHPADGFGDPLGRPPRAGILPDDESVEFELREAAARARAARISSEEPGPRAAYGRRRMWPGRPRRGAPPVPVDPRDDRFVP